MLLCLELLAVLVPLEGVALLAELLEDVLDAPIEVADDERFVRGEFEEAAEVDLPLLVAEILDDEARRLALAPREELEVLIAELLLTSLLALDAEEVDVRVCLGEEDLPALTRDALADWREDEEVVLLPGCCERGLAILLKPLLSC